jgi:tripartite-type tricarboxylate transporter receptor subunit TctC
MLRLTRLRQTALTAGVALATGLVATVADAQTAADYPTKTVTIVAPFPAGGSADIVGRWLAAGLQEKLKQTFIVENRAGANGSIGTGSVARAAPDGYTLLISGIGSNATNYSLYKKLPYANSDFKHVSLLITGPNVIAVNPDYPAKTLAEMIALAKSQEGKFQAANSGNGSSNHLGMAMLAKAAGFQVVHVPYRGGAPAITDVIAGHVPVITLNQDVLLPHVQAGKLRPLAVLSLERNPAYPNVPTVAEQGFPGFAAVSWFGLSAPAGTPQAIVDRLSKACNEIVFEAGLKKKLEASGFVVVGSSPQGAADFIQAEIDKWNGVVKANNISLD